jgi:hypothetical protein
MPLLILDSVVTERDEGCTVVAECRGCEQCDAGTRVSPVIDDGGRMVVDPVPMG